MKVWALADLHLSLSVPEKSMARFGWDDYHTRIRSNWIAAVAPEDVVLIPGDITWAMKLDDALVDLQWIDELPGTKIISKGNHDYWWPSNAKLSAKLPQSISFVNGSTITYDKFSVCGTRLHDVPGVDFSHLSGVAPPPVDEKIFTREMKKLERALSGLTGSVRIAMVHYPPINADLASNEVSALLEKYSVTHCVFGHLHALKTKGPLFGMKNGVNYHYVAADWVHFAPQVVLSL